MFLSCTLSSFKTMCASMASLSNAEFERICAGSEDNDIEEQFNSNGKRIRRNVLCASCNRKISKSAYYRSHGHSLWGRESSSEDDCINDVIIGDSERKVSFSEEIERFSDETEWD